MLIFASYLFGLVHDTLNVRVLPLTDSPEDLQSLSGVFCCDRLFMSFTISGVKQTVCFCGMPLSVISHRPGRICGPVCASAGVAATRAAATRRRVGMADSRAVRDAASLGTIPGPRNRGPRRIRDGVQVPPYAGARRSSRSTIQCLTGTLAPPARWVWQPTFAVRTRS